MADENDREARIRMRAHQLWEREGRPDGQEARHWEEAAREIDGEDGAEGDGQKQDLASGGISSGLQSGGTMPGGGPGAGADSIGAGGGSTAGSPSGNVKRSSK